MNAVAAQRELLRFLCARLAVERELFFRTVTHLPHDEVLNAWDNHAFALFEEQLRHAPRPKRRTTALTRIARGRCIFRRARQLPRLVPETEQRWSRVA